MTSSRRGTTASKHCWSRRRPTHHTRRMQTIDKDPASHKDYWLALTDLMQQQIDAEVAADRADRATLSDQRRAQNGARSNGAAAPKAQLPAVEAMVAEALQGTHDELLELEEYVQQELAAPACPDPEFWQSLRPRCVPAGLASTC